MKPYTHHSIGSTIAFFQHPDRDCAYAEADTVLKNQADKPESAESMVRILHAHSYPKHAGLVGTGFMIRRHNDARLITAAMERWWGLISTKSWRDQLSINFVLRQEEIEYTPLTGSLWRNEAAEYTGHRPKPWKGLQCGGAYLDADEYEAIEQMVGDLGIQSGNRDGGRRDLDALLDAECEGDLH